jgi:hypothetical protein
MQRGPERCDLIHRNCYGLDMKCFPTPRIMYEKLGPQLVVLFWEVLEILGDRTLLEEVGH